MNKPSPTKAAAYVRTPDIVQDEINAAYALTARNGRKSWRRLAAIEKYAGIPAGTLCAIGKSTSPDRDIPYGHYDHPGIMLPHPEVLYPCKACGKVHDVKITCPDKRDSHAPRFAIYKGSDHVENSVALMIKHIERDVLMEICERVMERTK